MGLPAGLPDSQQAVGPGQAAGPPGNPGVPGPTRPPRRPAAGAALGRRAGPHTCRQHRQHPRGPQTAHLPFRVPLPGSGERPHRRVLRPPRLGSPHQRERAAAPIAAQQPDRPDPRLRLRPGHRRQRAGPVARQVRRHLATPTPSTARSCRPPSAPTRCRWSACSTPPARSRRPSSAPSCSSRCRPAAWPASPSAPTTRNRTSSSAPRCSTRPSRRAWTSPSSSRCCKGRASSSTSCARTSPTAVRQPIPPQVLPVQGRVPGILLARVVQDEAQIEFERRVQALLFVVEEAYWELYGAYWDLYSRDNGLKLAHLTWQLYQQKFKAGGPRGRRPGPGRGAVPLLPDAATGGAGNGTAGRAGVLEAERRLRYVVGLPAEDGFRLMPSDTPALAPWSWTGARPCRRPANCGRSCARSSARSPPPRWPCAGPRITCIRTCVSSPSTASTACGARKGPVVRS